MLTPDEEETIEQFEYFVVRIRRAQTHCAAPSDLVGLVERLGTGEKTEFDSEDRLIQLIRE